MDWLLLSLEKKGKQGNAFQRVLHLSFALCSLFDVCFLGLIPFVPFHPLNTHIKSFISMVHFLLEMMRRNVINEAFFILGYFCTVQYKGGPEEQEQFSRQEEGVCIRSNTHTQGELAG